MERKKRELTVKDPESGLDIVVVLNDYITGAEYEELQTCGVKDQALQFNQSGSAPVMSIGTEEVYNKRKRKLFDLVVVSVNGVSDKESNYNTLSLVRSSDWIRITREIESIVSGLDQAEAKN
jgi:hypothetical protein